MKPEPVIVTGLTKHLCRYTLNPSCRPLLINAGARGLHNTFIDN